MYSTVLVSLNWSNNCTLGRATSPKSLDMTLVNSRHGSVNTTSVHSYNKGKSLLLHAYFPTIAHICDVTSDQWTLVWNQRYCQHTVRFCTILWTSFKMTKPQGFFLFQNKVERAKWIINAKVWSKCRHLFIKDRSQKKVKPLSAGCVNTVVAFWIPIT